jgi:transposase
MSRNKKWSLAAKFSIALGAVKGDCTINEICEKHQVSASQVHAWKKQLLETGKSLFEKNSVKTSSKKLAEKKRREAQLYEKIGQLMVERDFLKKSWEKLHGNDDED